MEYINEVYTKESNNDDTVSRENFPIFLSRQSSRRHLR